MKLLVFAHTPPPHHGQSYMVRLMLDGFGGDCRHWQPGADAPPHGIACYHINARVSKQLEDIGDFQFSKVLLLLGYCLQAIWCRFRYGVENFYYIPAPGKPSALYRDWLVMFLCRPFFKRLVLHWHAAGLAKWLETSVQIRSRSITYRAMKDADLCIVLSQYNRADAEKLLPRQIKVVSNGIVDPCPGFERDVLPRRALRREMRARIVSGGKLTGDERAAAGDPHVVNVLYLAHCMREKGLFDAMAGVLSGNQKLARLRLPLCLRLMVAGNFASADEKAEFDRLLAGPEAAKSVHYLGFVSGDQKNRVLREADVFCFPTYYQNENQPVNLIEAMAFGLPAVTTRWRSLPEMFPAEYPGLVNIRSPGQIADALLRLLTDDAGEVLRRAFVKSFTSESHLAGLAEALRGIERTVTAPESTSPTPAFRA
jgi:glycosyltransferase involved in cell wall biosynthesis